MKLVIAAAFGAGYVLGTKAGRDRYEQLVTLGQRAARGLDTTRPHERLESYAGRLEAFASRNGHFAAEPVVRPRGDV